MAAYVISEVKALDPESFATYRAIAQTAIGLYDGRYIVRGGPIDLVEGEWDENRQLVIVEFPSLERARQWYRSPEYAQALQVRDKALTRTLVFVDGVASGI